MNSDIELRVEQLTKSFGTQRVLDGINLELSRGETIAILGQSGTGKSVLLRLLIGLQKPDSGRVVFDDKNIPEMDLAQLNELRKKVGFLFQQAALFDSLTIEENVEFPLVRHSALTESERKDRVRHLLQSVGLEDAASKMPAEISGGMQKRVGLARALSLDPELLLLDEPTSALDPITADEIAGLIREIQDKRNVSSIVVTHDLRNAAAFANRLLMLREGKVISQGTLEDLKRSRDPFVAGFLKAAA